MFLKIVVEHKLFYALINTAALSGPKELAFRTTLWPAIMFTNCYESLNSVECALHLSFNDDQTVPYRQVFWKEKISNRKPNALLISLQAVRSKGLQAGKTWSCTILCRPTKFCRFERGLL